MNYLDFVKQIGWERLAGVVVRVIAALVDAVVKLVTRRKPVPLAPVETVRVTVLSISTETIAVTRLGDKEELARTDTES